MKTGKFVAPFFALAGCMLLVTQSQAAPPLRTKTLDVGVVLRFNDKFNDTVSAMYTGIETAKALFEKRHPGVHIQLHQFPHGEDLESVVAAADRVLKAKTPAVIGGELSEESFVLRDKFEPAKTVFITPTSSNPAVTENKSYIFRACFSDRLVADQLEHLVVDHLKASSIGLVHNVSSPYTDFLSNQFLDTFKKRMSAIDAAKRIPLHEEKILRDTMDFSQQIRNFMEHKVTHVAMLTHQNDLLRFAIQAADKGFFPVYVGSDGWGSNAHVFDRLVKEAPHGNRFIAYRNSYWKEDADTPTIRAFRAQYAKMFTREPTAWSAVSFDAAWILFTAMNRASNPKAGDQIRDQMRAIERLSLVTSSAFAFGPDNSPRKDLHIYRIDKNGIRYEVTLK